MILAVDVSKIKGGTSFAFFLKSYFYTLFVKTLIYVTCGMYAVLYVIYINIYHCHINKNIVVKAIYKLRSL